MKNDIWYLSIRSRDGSEIIYEYYTNNIDYALAEAREQAENKPWCTWEIENISIKATDSNAET